MEQKTKESNKGIGASLPRREDGRYLSGKGRFIADMRFPGMLEMAFYRSPAAHARIGRITKPARHAGHVFTAADLTGVDGIRADSGLPGFRSSVLPILASEKVRHVGEPIVACLAETRAEAEDIVDLVEVELADLPAVHEMTTALDADAPLVHDHWDKNAFLETEADTNFEEARKGAAAVVKRTYRTARQCMAPIEGRGVIACWDNQLELLTLHSATQMPHLSLIHI